jgi:short-subunit dehydrogenase
MSKTIFITGASSGIGKATVELFAAKGWKVIATMRKPDNIFAHLPQVTVVAMDVNNDASVHLAVRETIGSCGSIDVVVNNAGFGTFGPFEHATALQIEGQFNTNVLGVMRVTQAFIPHMRHNQRGIIINITSMVGRMTVPLYSLYASTKHAIEGFSESLYYELRPFGIKVKVVEPGPVKTDFNGRSQVDTPVPGDSPYWQMTQKVESFFKRTYRHAEPSSRVAKTIYRAANSRCNRLRYVSGFGGKLFVTTNRLLPLWMMRLFQRLLTGI